MSKSKITQGRQMPVTIGSTLKSGQPTIRNDGNDTIITHQEFFFDLAGNTSATLPTFNSTSGYSQVINPANPALFPWLSTIATSYETYKFLKLEFVYQGLCSTGTGGSVILAVDYDPTDQSPLTKQDMLAYQDSVRSSAWDTCVHRSSPSNLSRQREYFNQYLVEYLLREAYDDTPTQRSKFNDVGIFYAAALSNTSNLTMGELYVRYTVKLSKSQLNAREITRFTNAYSKLSQPYDYPFTAGQFYLKTTIPLYVGISGTPDRLYFSSAFSKYMVILRFEAGNVPGTFTAGPAVTTFGGAFVDSTIVQSINDVGNRCLYIATISCRTAGASMQILAPSPSNIIGSWSLNIIPQGKDNFTEWGITFVS